MPDQDRSPSLNNRWAAGRVIGKISGGLWAKMIEHPYLEVAEGGALYVHNDTDRPFTQVEVYVSPQEAGGDPTDSSYWDGPIRISWSFLHHGRFRVFHTVVNPRRFWSADPPSKTVMADLPPGKWRAEWLFCTWDNYSRHVVQELEFA